MDKYNLSANQVDKNKIGEVIAECSATINLAEPAKVIDAGQQSVIWINST